MHIIFRCGGYGTYLMKNNICYNKILNTRLVNIFGRIRFIIRKDIDHWGIFQQNASRKWNLHYLEETYKTELLNLIELFDEKI